jgi:hypothetical protein
MAYRNLSETFHQPYFQDNTRFTIVLSISQCEIHGLGKGFRLEDILSPYGLPPSLSIVETKNISCEPISDGHANYTNVVASIALIDSDPTHEYDVIVAPNSDTFTYEYSPTTYWIDVSNETQNVIRFDNQVCRHEDGSPQYNNVCDKLQGTIPIHEKKTIYLRIYFHL